MRDEHDQRDAASSSSQVRTVPQGLRDKNRAYPFLGVLRSSHDRLVAGVWDEIVLDYTVGESGIADGARLKIAFKFYTDWALFQTSDPTAANYVSAEYSAGSLVPGQGPATVQALKVSFDQKGHERPFQKALLIDIVDGYLNPGDRITIRLGDRRGGGSGTRVQTFEEKGFAFRAFVDPLGTSKFAPVPGDVRIDIVSGPPAALSIVTRRLAGAVEIAPVRIRAFDRWGNVCLGLNEDLEVSLTNSGGEAEETQTYQFPKAAWAVVKFDVETSGREGELQITARIPALPNMTEARATLRIDHTPATPRLWFADLHVHSEDTVGINNTEYNLTYGRDVAGLDVLGYTANDFNITEKNWNAAVDLIHCLHTDGEFVCFPGTEWCGNSCAGGDHNVIFLHGNKPEFPFDRAGNSTRSFEMVGCSHDLQRRHSLGKIVWLRAP